MNGWDLVAAVEQERDDLRREVARLRAELAEWTAENGMNRTFIREEMTRMSAAVEAARLVLEWPRKKYLVQLNLALESLDAARSPVEESV